MVACYGCGVWSFKDVKLSNKHLRVVVVPWKPFLTWKCPTHTGYRDWWSREVNGGKDRVYYAKTSGTSGGRSNGTVECPNGEDRMYSGILWELLMFMKQARNLTYTIVGMDDAWWGGTCYDSNNCTGMVGSVNRHEADIALGL